MFSVFICVQCVYMCSVCLYVFSVSCIYMCSSVFIRVLCSSCQIQSRSVVFKLSRNRTEPRIYDFVHEPTVGKFYLAIESRIMGNSGVVWLLQIKLNQNFNWIIFLEFDTDLLLLIILFYFTEIISWSNYSTDRRRSPDHFSKKIDLADWPCMCICALSMCPMCNCTVYYRL